MAATEVVMTGGHMHKVVQIFGHLFHFLSNKTKSTAHISHHDLIDPDSVRGLAHDLKSPLGVMESLLSSMGFKRAEEEQLFQAALLRLKLLCSRALQENSSEMLPPRMIEDILADAERFLRAQIPTRKKILTEVHVDPLLSSRFFAYDTLQLERVLQNILCNAMEAIEREGKIVIRAIKNEHSITLIIQDDGIGIPDHLQMKLGREKLSYNKEGGHGLGLYMARTLMLSWGGQLRITSKLGIGTLISLEIPLPDLISLKH